jgi:hypothetical protein
MNSTPQGERPRFELGGHERLLGLDPQEVVHVVQFAIPDNNVCPPNRDTADRSNSVGAKRDINLAAQVSDIDFHSIGTAAGERPGPHGVEDVGLGECPVLVTHPEFQQSVFARGQIDICRSPLNRPAGRIQDQGARSEDHRPLGCAAPDQSAQPGHENAERKGLR